MTKVPLIGIQLKATGTKMSEKGKKTTPDFGTFIATVVNLLQGQNPSAGLLEKGAKNIAGKGSLNMVGRLIRASEGIKNGEGPDLLPEANPQKANLLNKETVRSFKGEEPSKAQVDGLKETKEVSPLKVEAEGFKNILKKDGRPVAEKRSSLKKEVSSLRPEKGQTLLDAPSQRPEPEPPEGLLKIGPFKGEFLEDIKRSGFDRDEEVKALNKNLSATMVHTLSVDGGFQNNVESIPEVSPTQSKGSVLSAEPWPEFSIQSLKENAISLELRDKELGKLSLKVEVNHHHVRAELFVDSVKALQRISETLSELAMNLSREGLNLEQFSLGLGSGQRHTQDREEPLWKAVPSSEGSKKTTVEPLRPLGLLSIKA
ncbi:MAG: flagellar hook-length control protein FliK [Nitrospirae bacterium]|nr:MAG: flagellar hook-length control protein FliK [Nitrospirota bacterium]